MTIDMIEPGQKIELEVFVGDASFLIQTRVIGNSKGAILTEPYTYKGVVVDFSSTKMKNMSFHLHCIDSESKSRKVWNNVDVRLISYQGKDYYGIQARGFGIHAKSSERREGNRIKLDLTGEVLFNDNYLSMQTVDICESGFAFLTKEKFAAQGNLVTVKFSDKAHDVDFDMVIKLRLVRVEQRGDEYFYAGTVAEQVNNLLAYICFKRLDQKQNKNLLQVAGEKIKEKIEEIKEGE